MLDYGEHRAAEWLAAWDAQGIHRSATAGDAAGADWLMREAAALGAEPVFEDFAVDRLDPVTAYLEIEGTRLSGVPVFDAPATSSEGMTGALGLLGGKSPLAIAEMSPGIVYTPAYQSLRGEASCRGLAIVCKGGEPGLGLLNAEQFRRPYGAPAIHLPSEARELVFAAAARGAPARLVADSRRLASRARNLVVAMPGCDPTRTPVVVMTPRSSWWQSTSERGGGLVCWLELLRALIAARPECNVVFTANSGHELGHLGLDAFAARRPGWGRPVERGGAIWVHYGANLGAIGGDLAVHSADAELAALTAAELARAGRAPDRIAPRSAVPSGETRDIHRAGGRYVTLVGSNPLFHLPQDRWPYAVDAAAVARIAAGAARMLIALTR